MSAALEELKAQIVAMRRELEELKAHARSMRPWTEWAEAQFAAVRRERGRTEAQIVTIQHMLGMKSFAIQRELEELKAIVRSMQPWTEWAEGQVTALQGKPGDLKANGSRAAEAGIGFGSVLAIILSFTLNHSVGWAILHGICSWFYVIYRVWAGNY
jgi:hypothetical protein